jgi:predicted nucleotidyltransferase
MIYIEPRHLEIVKNILKKYPYTFYVYGSRARGDQKRLSDLDLATYDEISWQDKVKLEEAFEESDLPYTVDLIDLNKISRGFFDSIKKDLVRIT